MLKLDPFETGNFILAGKWSLDRAEKSEDSQERVLFYQLALQRYKRARILQPSNPNLVKRIAELNTKWGQDRDESQFPNAIAWWKKALQSQPTDSSVHRSYGMALMSYADARQKDQALYGRALKEFITSARFNPTSSDIWNKIGTAYGALSDFPNARSAYARALKLRPGDPEATERLKALRG